VFHGFKVKRLWERNWIVIFSKRKPADWLFH